MSTEHPVEAVMGTPIVTEITRRPHAVEHDPFLDDLRAAYVRPTRYESRKERGPVTGPLAGCSFDVRMPPSNR